MEKEVELDKCSTSENRSNLTKYTLYAEDEISQQQVVRDIMDMGIQLEQKVSKLEVINECEQKIILLEERINIMQRQYSIDIKSLSVEIENIRETTKIKDEINKIKDERLGNLEEQLKVILSNNEQLSNNFDIISYVFENKIKKYEEQLKVIESNNEQLSTNNNINTRMYENKRKRLEEKFLNNNISLNDEEITTDLDIIDNSLNYEELIEKLSRIENLKDITCIQKRDSNGVSIKHFNKEAADHNTKLIELEFSSHLYNITTHQRHYKIKLINIKMKENDTLSIIDEKLRNLNHLLQESSNYSMEKIYTVKRDNYEYKNLVINCDRELYYALLRKGHLFLNFKSTRCYAYTDTTSTKNEI